MEKNFISTDEWVTVAIWHKLQPVAESHTVLSNPQTVFHFIPLKWVWLKNLNSHSRNADQNTFCIADITSLALQTPQNHHQIITNYDGNVNISVKLKCRCLCVNKLKTVKQQETENPLTRSSFIIIFPYTKLGLVSKYPKTKQESLWRQVNTSYLFLLPSIFQFIYISNNKKKIPSSCHWSNWKDSFLINMTSKPSLQNPVCYFKLY